MGVVEKKSHRSLKQTGPPTGTEPDYFSRQVVRARRFYLDLDPDRRQPLSVVSGGWERCAPDYVIDRPGFPHRVIEFVASGVFSLRMRNHVYRLSAGAVFTYGPGVAHALRVDPNHSPLKYFIVFAGSQCERLFRQAELDLAQVSQVPVPHRVRQLLDELISAGMRRTARSPSICAALLEALMLTIGDCAVDHGTHNLRAFAKYRQCREWLENNPGAVSTLKEAARRCHVDAAYLCRLFHRFDQETPYQLIQRLRLQRAIEILHDSDFLVKEVAEELGYADAFHFSRAFKRIFGISPSKLMRHRD